jgi:Enzyme involved in the deoxyxylulose pathway of isoprenoid biosynthesis
MVALCANSHCYPLFDILQYIDASYIKHEQINFVMMDAAPNIYTPETEEAIFSSLKHQPNTVLCLSSTRSQAISDIRNCCYTLKEKGIVCPIVIIVNNDEDDMLQSLIHYSVEAGSLLLEGLLHGICLGYKFGSKSFSNDELNHQHKTLNSIAFGILQATRTRISKTEYISCPSCGRTLFDLQETTAKIRAVTHHLKGVKIAIMGCIVNGPGEMADADFGYVGSGVGKITLYKNKEIVKRNIDSEVAVDELVSLLKENGVWVEKGDAV